MSKNLDFCYISEARCQAINIKHEKLKQRESKVFGKMNVTSLKKVPVAYLCLIKCTKTWIFLTNNNAERRSNHHIKSDASSIKKEKCKIIYLLRFWWIVLKVCHKKRNNVHFLCVVSIYDSNRAKERSHEVKLEKAACRFLPQEKMTE